MTASLTPLAQAGQPLGLAGARLVLRPSGALWWPGQALLAVADLHLGRAERLARRGGALLPPYESADGLARLEAEAAALGPEQIALVGDSVDDGPAAEALPAEITARIAALAERRRLTWIAGNHDPRPTRLPGAHAAELRLGPLVFRHIAKAGPPQPGEAGGEVSGHFHPKARLAHGGRRISRACFLADRRRLILPAFGTYTGGLDAASGCFDDLLGPEATAFLIGTRIVALPRAGLSL